MRPVNLLPEGARPRAAGGRPGSAYAVVGVLAALFVAVLVYVLTANQVTAKQDELAQAERDTAAAEARSAALGGFGDFAQIKATREASVQALAQSRLDWERLMRELARLLPRDVSLISLDASTASGGVEGAAGGDGPAGPSVELSGCAPAQADVATTMVRLRGLHGAAEVRLTDSARSQSEGSSGGSGGEGECSRGYRFSVAVDLAEAPAGGPAPERVPAHLGGGR